MIRARRTIEEFSISFLDVICCGFGAVILLLMITQNQLPVSLKQTNDTIISSIEEKETDLTKIVESAQNAQYEIETNTIELKKRTENLTKIQERLNTIRAQYDSLQNISKEMSSQNLELAKAKQSLTKEMQNLLGSDFRRRSDLVGGITVDSEYIIFVIDTSGSMQAVAWPTVVRKVSETLSIYPTVKGIQVMNDMGDYMFSSYKGEWMQDSPATRNSIIKTLTSWSPFSNSSPVEGIREAIYTYYDPDKNISIYVFGDDYTGNSVEEVVDVVDQINVADENGNRRVRIHAVGFPVYIDRPNQRVYRFASLMRELAYRNNGTFVALANL